jgi:hypothetical protein
LHLGGLLVREETDAPPFYCFVNVISFWTWAGGDRFPLELGIREKFLRMAMIFSLGSSDGPPGMARLQGTATFLQRQIRVQTGAMRGVLLHHEHAGGVSGRRNRGGLRHHAASFTVGLGRCVETGYSHFRHEVGMHVHHSGSDGGSRSTGDRAIGPGGIAAKQDLLAEHRRQGT